MLFRLSETSSLPLREQLAKQIRSAILVGELSAREQLPSIRSLARELRVGTITVQHAYEALERERLLYARTGKGYFVAPLSHEQRQAVATTMLQEGLQPILRDALEAGLEPSQIQAALDTILRGGEL